MGAHLIGGLFKSDKYEWCPAGFVPLKVSDKMAQPELWSYAQKRRAVDSEFGDDLEEALKLQGFERGDPIIVYSLKEGTGTTIVLSVATPGARKPALVADRDGAMHDPSEVADFLDSEGDRSNAASGEAFHDAADVVRGLAQRVIEAESGWTRVEIDWASLLVKRFFGNLTRKDDKELTGRVRDVIEEAQSKIIAIHEEFKARVPQAAEGVAPALGMMPEEIDLDGHVDGKGVRYVGKAQRQDDGKYVCLADVGGMLCRVEVTLTLDKKKP